MDTFDIKVNESLIKGDDAWLHFANPYRVIVAETVEDVVPALQEVEKLTQTNGWYASGFLSYESASAFDSAFQTRPKGEFPYLWFGLYPKPRSVALPKPDEAKEVLDWHPTICPDTYNTAIAKIKDHIAQGRTYQVNYTMRLEADFAGNAWGFFLHLAQNQNRCAAYINMGRYVICSASPELFFQLDGDTITCRPMKGTAARERTTVEDQERSHWLRHSLKNLAENVMIVDMIRNDLGKIAKVGSIAVPHLFETERYPTLWQMTSTVTAKTEASLSEIFAALFPCSSITGAPKVSTMRIIAELESTARRIYTGTIGYITPNRKAKFNVAIRTALIDSARDKIEYGVGGGIVWDSDSPDEYSEALLKARVLTEQTSQFSLLETMLWNPREDFFLREKHIARLIDSADYFEIPVTKEILEEYLEQISSGFLSPQRVRVLLDRDGSLTSESSLFDVSKDTGPLKIGLAKEPVDSRNIFLFHKTTQREVYESARKGLEGFDDVLLYNENYELTEFTIGNLVVKLDGQLFTPALSCGVLAGTFRRYLIETGQVLERTLSIQDLAHCTKIFRVNSIRRWQIAEIQ
jgi:para-aminobenzoate synthetase / 4-amino-4-deoxychorismate lyase